MTTTGILPLHSTRAGVPCAVLTLLALLVSPGLSAQKKAAPAGTESGRDGLHFSVGLGAGSMGASCDQCETNFFSDRINGLSGFVQLGGALTPGLILTGEFTGWLKNDEFVRRRVAGLSLGVLGYPDPTSGFFLKGSVGAVRAVLEDDAFVFQTDAWMAVTGVGIDIAVSEGVSITPYLNYIRSFGGETTADGFVSPVPVHPNAFQLGAALTVN